MSNEIVHMVNHYKQRNIDIKDIKIYHDYDKDEKIITFTYKKMDDLNEGTMSMPYNRIMDELSKDYVS